MHPHPIVVYLPPSPSLSLLSSIRSLHLPLAPPISLPWKWPPPHSTTWLGAALRRINNLARDSAGLGEGAGGEVGTERRNSRIKQEAWTACESDVLPCSRKNIMGRRGSGGCQRGEGGCKRDDVTDKLVTSAWRPRGLQCALWR